MIASVSIGYEAKTGIEHLVEDDDPHPGEHLLSAACPCVPRLDRYRWIHRRTLTDG